jgi:hypothetical protein
MIGAGRWRCSLGWMPIHTVMTISPITRGRLRSRIGEKRTSTLISRHLVFDSRVCVNIFKSCLPTPMMTPSNGIIFTTNFTPFMNLFCRYTRVLTFFGRYTRAFCLICSGPWCSRTTVQTRCQQVPPPALIDYQQILTYRKDKHTSGGGKGKNIDWAEYYWWA